MQWLLSKAPVNKPTNMACHNLTTKGWDPNLAKHLLGLGLNFSIKSKHPTNNIKATISKFTNCLHWKYFIADNKDDFELYNNSNYNPGFYKQSTWTPPHWKFASDLKATTAKFKKQQSSENLSLLQWKFLRTVTGQNFIIFLLIKIYQIKKSFMKSTVKAWPTFLFGTQ